MSERYPGGIISKNAPTVTASPPSAPGVWTMDQQAQYAKAGTWPFGGPFTYIEDVFSTYLYTGNGSTQTITNGIDLSGKGGLVWGKSRSGAYNHELVDTVRGAGKAIRSNLTAASTTLCDIDSFTSTGFTLTNGGGEINTNTVTEVAWTFRKQPKFFDVVTYTGDGVAGRTIAHSLGSTPGMMIVKCTSTTGQWAVYHRTLGGNYRLYLDSTGMSGADSGIWNNTDPTSTVFTVGSGSQVNASTRTYVAYLFAHNAGGFGLTGTDNVISCGSFTGSNVSDVTVSLGYEPQFILWKTTTSVDSWKIADNMRGMPIGSSLSSNTANLFPNSSTAETVQNGVSPTATGFTWYANGAVAASDTYIYIAIRRGPMKTPTSGTSVFSPLAYSGNSTTDRILTSGFPVDLAINSTSRTSVNADKLQVFPRLTGGSHLATASTAAEVAASTILVRGFDNNTGIRVGNGGDINSSGQTYVDWMFSRAPGFFDVVCYTGDGTLNPRNHNLAVTPELVIVKRRSSDNGWFVSQYLSSPSYGQFNTTAAFTSQGSSYPVTSTTFVPVANTSGQTLVAYLFASCPGVSKVGSYTGTGATQTISCGFTGGARWVLIKRTDSTGDWYVWDSARGMVAGTDPSLLLNSTAAEVNANSVYTTTGGFQIVSTAAGINASGGTYIYLAIA